MKWQRPDNIPYPKTYFEFEGKVDVQGKKRKYWIQDLTEEYYELVIEGYVADFLKNEPICSHSNILEDKDAVQDFRELWLELLKQKISLICLTKDEQGKPKVAGFNTLCVVSKGHEESKKYRSRNSKKINDLMDYMSSQRDAFAELNINEYLYAFGLSVLEEFRGEGLGQIIIDARKPLCATFNLKASLTVFTSFISQKQAYRCGFKDFVSIAYDDMPEELKTDNISQHSTHCKLMYIVY